MKLPITRWKTVPSYKRSLVRSPLLGSVHSLAPVARSTKFATVFGACSGMRRTVNEPMFVTKVAVVIQWAFPVEGARSLAFRVGPRILEGRSDDGAGGGPRGIRGHR